MFRRFPAKRSRRIHGSAVSADSPKPHKMVVLGENNASHRNAPKRTRFQTQLPPKMPLKRGRVVDGARQYDRPHGPHPRGIAPASASICPIGKRISSSNPSKSITRSTSPCFSSAFTLESERGSSFGCNGRIWISNNSAGGQLRSQRNWFDRVLEATKLPDYTWHCNPHTFASRLVMNGVDLRTVGELLVQQTFQMTTGYAHLAADHKHEAVSRPDKGIGTGRSARRGPQRAA